MSLLQCVNRIALGASVFLMVSCAGAVDDVSVPGLRVSASKTVISIGDRIRYTIEITAREGVEFEFPNFKKGIIGDFEIRDSGAVIKKHLFGKRTIVRWYDITSYAVGTHLVPEFEIRYHKKGGTEFAILKTSPLTVTVKSILPKGQAVSDIKDIKGPLLLYGIPWFLIAVAGAIIIVCVSSVMLYKKFKKKKRLRSPFEVALEELEAARGAFSRTGDVKAYYVKISDAARHYIENVFSLRAPEMTTEEFLVSLNSSAGLSPAHKDILREFLKACDLVKFARYTPTRLEIESVFTEAKKFIEESKEVPEKKES